MNTRNSQKQHLTLRLMNWVVWTPVFSDFFPFHSPLIENERNSMLTVRCFGAAALWGPAKSESYESKKLLV